MMLKVVIFGSGWGGEMFASYLEENVNVLEVVREIDWTRGNYCKYGKREIRSIAESRLQEYIGKVDLIVLASYTISEVALDYLSERYPNQKFMGFLPRLAQRLCPQSGTLAYELREYMAQLDLKKRIYFVLSGYGRTSLHEHLVRFFDYGSRDAVLVLASDKVKGSRRYKDDLRQLGGKYRILEPKCEELAKKIDEGADPAEALFWALPVAQDVHAVLIYGTTFVRIKETLEKFYGWRVKVYDDFYKSAREVCRALNIHGMERVT